MGTKGARITSHVSLPGRYLVFMPTVEHVGVSRKITDDEERRRLKTVLKEFRQERGGGGLHRAHRGPGPRGRGLPARRALPLPHLGRGARARRAPARPGAALPRALARRAAAARPALGRRSPRSASTTSASSSARSSSCARSSPSSRRACGCTTARAAIMEEHGVTAELERALRSKVWLPAGGYIVINQTEALVAIDVNTGRFVGKNDARGDAPQGQPRRGARDRAPDPAARPRRHHRRRLHRHGGAQEPARGDARARAGAAQGPLADEAPLGERVRPRDPDPQARQAVARAAAAASPARTARAAAR